MATFFFLLLTITALFFHPAVSKTHRSDIQALKQLRLAVSPDSLSPASCLSSWDFSLDPCDSLYGPKFTCGFTCSAVSGGATTRVTELALDQAGYSAPLAAVSWGNLRFLRSLDLSGNNFSGPIPESLSELTQLQKLTLSMNSLSGPIPDSLGRLGQLEELALDNNALSGAIPAGFSGLVSLTRLELQTNKLAGEFPDLSRLGNLTFLDITGNSISGDFPASLPANLLEISMRSNDLSGNLPETIPTNLPFLQVLDLSENQLAGSIPASLFTHPNLQQLVLSHNNLTSISDPGSGPARSSGLIAIDLSSNQLSGLLPGSPGLMPRLSALSLEDNRFSGLIPIQYALKAVLPGPGVARLERLLLGGNYLFGPIPDPFMRLEPGGAVKVNLGDNCLMVCPEYLFFCKGGEQKSMGECRDTIGPIIP